MGRKIFRSFTARKNKDQTNQVVSSEVDLRLKQYLNAQKWTPKPREKILRRSFLFLCVRRRPENPRRTEDESNKDSQFASSQFCTNKTPCAWPINSAPAAVDHRTRSHGVQKATTFRELWREDCTHAQQWDASVGCCGESCCFTTTITASKDDDIATANKRFLA